MNIYARKQQWKLLLIAAAVVIGITSLWYTNLLVEKLAGEERKKVELWAEAIRTFADTEYKGDYTFISKVVEANTTIPVILAEMDGTVISFLNLDTTLASEKEYLKEQLAEMSRQNPPIEVKIHGDLKQYVYYKNSHLLTQLSFFPFIQLGVISLFILVSYFAFSSSRRAEQNQVWMGMAKETAHQLGTPLSSLMAWVEVLREKKVDESLTSQITIDLSRLEMITERFSKIGSAPVLQSEILLNALEEAIGYMRSRISKKMNIRINPDGAGNISVPLNRQLFGWVVENLCKNAADAMNGTGDLVITVKDQMQYVYIDVTDTGKGIPRSKFKTVFNPGYSTKKRSWGLGLSLSKRIIENYHGGNIFVKYSELNKGTTFRIVLKK